MHILNQFSYTLCIIYRKKKEQKNVPAISNYNRLGLRNGFRLMALGSTVL